MKDRLKEIAEQLKQTPKLSTEEKAQIQGVFDGLSQVLDATLETILCLDRLEAYRYTHLIVAAFRQIIADYQKEVTPPEEPAKPAEPSAPTEKADLKALVQQLPPKLQAVAKRVDCVSQLEEVGDDVICSDCSLEKLIECVRIIDPSIDPAQDIIDEVEKMRAAQSK